MVMIYYFMGFFLSIALTVSQAHTHTNTLRHKYIHTNTYLITHKHTLCKHTPFHVEHPDRSMVVSLEEGSDELKGG